MTPRIPYRPEVDGLRAVAVLAVVLFHLDLPAFGGGFIGVDCFFVISGFLIFSLLRQEQRTAGSIDWSAFYARRITRLFPEACAVIVAVIASGHFLLLPVAPDIPNLNVVSQHALAESGATASLWSANFHFWLQRVGYFQVWVGREPFLHLWSLGVEEQFYLLVPAMFALAGFGSRTLGTSWTRVTATLLALVAVSSLAAAVWWTKADPPGAYYLLPTRAYEFAVGAAVGLWLLSPSVPRLPHWSLTPIAGAGFAVIVGCVLQFDRAMPFPGALALAPTLATAAVIYACGASTASPFRQALATPSLTYIGKISYGWYLWHWPMLVLWREYRLYDLPVWSEFVVAALAMVPAAIGHHAVAGLRKTVHANGVAPRQVIAFGAVGIAATLVSCGVLALVSHRAVMTPKGQVLDANLRDQWSAAPECIDVQVGSDGALPECVLGDPKGAVTVVLWGESHALHWQPVLDPLLKEVGMRGVLRMYPACPSGFSATYAADHFVGCSDFTAAVTRDVRRRAQQGPVVVLLLSRWSLYINEGPFSYLDRRFDRRAGEGIWLPDAAAVEPSLDDLVVQLKTAGVAIGIAMPVPELRYEAPNCLYRMDRVRCDVARSEVDAYLRPARNLVGAVAKRHGLEVLDPAAYLCREDTCFASIAGRALYFDDDHLSGHGAKLMRGPLEAMILKLADKARAGSLAIVAVPP